MWKKGDRNDLVTKTELEPMKVCRLPGERRFFQKRHLGIFAGLDYFRLAAIAFVREALASSSFSAHT